MIKSCFAFIYRIWRVFIGPMDACIYPISCSDYAAYQLASKPWYKAFFLIGFRVLSCNPLTAFILTLYYRIVWRKKN